MSAGAGTGEPLYWYDPMVPNQHFEKPGQSPFMDMQLVPKYAGGGPVDANVIRIEPGVLQNLGVRLARVERGLVAASVEGIGEVQYDQRLAAIVQTRVGGFVEGTHGVAPGDLVTAGAPLADLQVPAWAAAQAEFVALLEGHDLALIRAVRQRMQLLGMPPQLIERIESTRRIETTFTIRAPISGALESVEVRRGMSIDVGSTVARINGLNTVWVEVVLPSGTGDALHVGDEATVEVTGSGAGSVKGRIVGLLPEASDETRTLRARVAVANPAQTLHPGMYARVRFRSGGGDSVLSVPTEAVIRSGTRNVVISTQEGRFSPVVVVLGREGAGRTEILQGLVEGQQVVASSQFLIDSEASLQGVLARLAPGSLSESTAPRSATYRASGRVEAISAERWTISHGPVADLQWPSMTMGFIPPGAPSADIKVGDSVHFWFRKEGDDYTIERFEKGADRP